MTIWRRSSGILIMLLILCVHNNVVGQTFTPINNEKQVINAKRGVTIGSTIPDIHFTDIVNHSASTAKLSDFKSKLVILDFWNSGCTGCIRSFPAIQDLQNKFKGDLQILMIDYNSKVYKDNDIKVKQILKRFKDDNILINLPIILNCKQLDNSFPTVRLPQDVWIKDNKIIGITDGTVVNEKYIYKVLNGEKVNFRVKNDVVININDHSLFEILYGKGQNYHKPLFSSILYQGWIDGLNGNGFKRDAEGLYTGMFSFDRPLLEIVKKAYPSLLNSLPDNQIIVSTKDSTLFLKVNYGDESSHSRVYNYELSTRSVSDSDIIKIAQSDLEGKLGIVVKTDKRLMDCYILKSTPDLSGAYTKGGSPQFDKRYANNIVVFRNIPIKEIIQTFNLQFDRPLIDESGLTQNVDLNIQCEGIDLTTLTTGELIDALKHAGFDIQVQKRMMNVGVIADK